MATITHSHLHLNSYLQNRNKKFYRGHSNFVNPIYEKELNNAVTSITSFLDASILKYAYYKRLGAIYNLSAEKCFNNKNNNYSFSESEVCEETIIERDAVLSNIKDFNKEVEVRIQDLYEKQVKFAKGNSVDRDGEAWCSRKYDRDHRMFLLRVNFLYRYYYYFTAKRIFVDSWQDQK
jgi:hypothetical protein